MAYETRQEWVERLNERVDELAVKHPMAAVAYQALSWVQSANETKALLGDMAVLRLESGDNPSETKAEMDAMWVAYLISHGWKAGINDPIELREFHAEPQRVYEILEACSKGAFKAPPRSKA